MEQEKLDFKEYTKSKSDKSSVWNSFLRTADGLYAKCKNCKKIIKCKNTTTCLHNHLKLHRKDNEVSGPEPVLPKKSDDEIESKKRKVTNTIDQYFKSVDDTMEDFISKMTACDGLPFSVFCISDSIKKLFNKSGYHLPKSPKTIKKIVVTKSDEVKSGLKKELNVLKADGKKFSVSLDEWTSARNRRYMNINIHSPNFKGKPFKNLGLCKIVGRGTAECCMNILEQKLKYFDLSLQNDIACVVSDGASVMCAMGRRIPTFHQQCLAHGIQCAVVDVLYKRSYNERDENETQEETGESSESDYADEEEEEGFNIQQRERRNVARRPTLIYYKDLIQKVRTVVKFFKMSPTKSEILENYQAENKKLKMILDCRTRWSSMADMIARFLTLKEPVMKSLIDLKNEITFSATEINLLEEFSSSLNIIKATVESICQENANLLTAEAALKFMVGKLEENKSFISERLLEALKERIVQRRQTDLVSTLKYLHNPTNYYNQPPCDVFLTPSNNEIVKVIVDINAKYFCTVQDSDDEEDVSLVNLQRRQPQIELTQENQPTLSLKEQLQKSIDSTISSVPSTSTTNISTVDEFETSIRMQMALYDRGGPRQIHLSQVYEFLMSIPPSSVECERVFSSSKYIINHLRCALQDDSIDALSFLRSHYQSIRQSHE